MPPVRWPAANMFVTALSVAREFGGAIPALTIPDVLEQGTGRRRGQPAAEGQIGARANPAGVSGPENHLLRGVSGPPPAQGFSKAPTRRRASRDTPMNRSGSFPATEANLKVTYPHDVDCRRDICSAGGRAGM